MMKDDGSKQVVDYFAASLAHLGFNLKQEALNGNESGINSILFQINPVI